jgi:uncharacterized protein (DUF1697 family)
MNLAMPDLKRTLEAAGFTSVKTLLSSGNVAFDARSGTQAALEKKIEAALVKTLGKEFMTLVRTQEHLKALIDADPYAPFKLPKDAKRVVTFLREDTKATLKLPIGMENAKILALSGREVFSYYVPDPKKGPVFMTLLEKTYGKAVTTRTWDTVRKCAAA